LDDKVRQAVKKQKIVVDAFPRSPAALAIGSLASKALTWPIPKTPSGHLEFFVERLLNRTEMLEEPFGE
jgi:flagellar biosynthesis protein FlhG